MGYTLTIEVTAAGDEELHDHVAAWHAEQLGIAPGYQGARILADTAQANRYVVEVDFASQDEADRNNERPETAAWAAKLGELTSGEPAYRSFRLVCSTQGS